MLKYIKILKFPFQTNLQQYVISIFIKFKSAESASLFCSDEMICCGHYDSAQLYVTALSMNHFCCELQVFLFTAAVWRGLCFHIVVTTVLTLFASKINM